MKLSAALSLCIVTSACGADNEPSAAAGAANCGEARACLSEANAVIRDDGLLGIYFAGYGLESDVDSLMLDAFSPDGQSVDSYGLRIPVFERFLLMPNYGEIVFRESGRFEGFWVIGGSGAARVRIWVLDVGGGVSTPLELDLSPPAPRAVGLGEICDYDGLLYTCPTGSFCDRLDGAERALCQEPVVECLSDWTPIALETAASGDVGMPSDRTVGSCSFQRGGIGHEQVFRYVPEASGTYAFQAVGDAATLWLRRYCNLPQPDASEIACTEFNNVFPASESAATLEAPLEAGVPVFVFVEAAWSGGGPFTLTASRVN